MPSLREECTRVKNNKHVHYGRPTALIKPARPVAIHPRIVEALSKGSPFFGVLWPIIFEFSEAADQKRLRNVSFYFDALFFKEKTIRQSEHAKDVYYDEFHFQPDNPPPRICSLRKPTNVSSTLRLKLPESSFWYSWGASRCAFNKYDIEYGIDTFAAFCRLAGINQTKPMLRWRVDVRNQISMRVLDIREERFDPLMKDTDYWFTDKIMIVLGHPRENSMVRPLGVTGDKEVVMRMLEWYEGYWGGRRDCISYGKRRFI